MSQTVSKLARRLNRRCDKSGKFPPLLLMTDSKRLPDPASLLTRLPKGSGVIVRGFSYKEKEENIQKIKILCLKHRLKLYVSDSPQLARRYSLNGVHFSEKKLAEMLPLQICQLQTRGFQCSSAVHSKKALLRAQHAKIDMVLISPVFSTSSHPNAKTLGIRKVAQWTRTSRPKAYALGGINAKTTGKLYSLPLCGFAGISGLI